MRNKKLDIGFMTSTYELAQFYLLCPESGKLCGIWVSHVDDLLLAFNGESKFAQGVLATLKQGFTFGRWSVQDIVCCGRHFNQDDKFVVNIDMSDCIASLTTTRMSWER